jgi:hypothetical protein
MRTPTNNLVGVCLSAAFLTACGGGTGGASSPMPAAREPLTVGQARQDGVCYGQYTEMYRGGGKLLFPQIKGNFAARFDYAPYKERKAKFSTEYGQSVANCGNVPVPPGYTPDWFGFISVDGGNALQFQNKPTRRCEIQSSTFKRGTQYYLYIYDSSGNVLYANSIGTPDNFLLKFTSPFEDRFLIPGGINLELVH